MMWCRRRRRRPRRRSPRRRRLDVMAFGVNMVVASFIMKAWHFRGGFHRVASTQLSPLSLSRSTEMAIWGGSAATRRNMVIHNSMMRQSHVAGASTEIYRNRFRVYVKLMKPRLSYSTEHRWVGKFNKPKTPSCRISDSTYKCQCVWACVCAINCAKNTTTICNLHSSLLVLDSCILQCAFLLSLKDVIYRFSLNSPKTVEMHFFPYCRFFSLFCLLLNELNSL